MAAVLVKWDVPKVTQRDVLKKMFPDSKFEFYDDGSYKRTIPEGSTDIEYVFGKPKI
jgi:hypothetical protein